MINCSECLNNLNNGNLEQIKSSLELMVQIQELDPCTLEVLQEHICSNCTQA